ncbi:MAG: amidohydrolase family protein, partial [Alphaproteobacteria bacterium]|nr:amidohydrolase family protein [Alphaproteobacteria bacterium]
TLSIDGPAYNILDTMSKFLHLGMPLADIVRATTVNPADAVRREDLGRLSPGLPGEATVLEIQDGRFDYEDARGDIRTGSQKVACAGMVLGGRWWHDGNADAEPGMAAE